MDFYTVLSEVEDLLRSRGRVSYRALKVQYALDDERLGALREELLYAHPGKVIEDGQGLVWTAGASGTPDAERRQLTVMFCDLVGSTPLASQFDPEEWREVMRAYYETCEKVIARFDGHVANYLGDGLLIYFGYPRAHEDDAQRAVRAGLGIVEAVGQLNAVLTEKHGVSLAVRLGCHTGLVVIGELVRGTGHDDMVLGETPNIAARLQGIAAPNTLVIGALTRPAPRRPLRLRVVGHPAPQRCRRAAGGLPGALRKHRPHALGSARQRRPHPTGGSGNRAGAAREELGSRRGWPWAARPSPRRGGDR